MYFVKMLFVLLWFFIFPFGTGLFFTGKMTQNKNRIWMVLLSGYIFMFAVFEVMALPFIFLKQPFAVLKYGYCFLIVAFSVFCFLKERKRLPVIFANTWKEMKDCGVAGVIALLLIALQIGIYVIGMSTDFDDAFYVGTATTTLKTGTMFQYNGYTGVALKDLPSRYVLSPFPVLLAFYGDMAGMSPTIIAHTVMPIFFVALAYASYFLLGNLLFHEERKSTAVFLCFLSVIHIFSYYSVYTQGTFLLIRVWQGKAVLAAVLLPFLFFLSYRIFTEECGWAEWVTLLLLMISCCLVSSMGIMLAPIMLGIFALLYGLGKKQWKKFFYAVICCIPSGLFALAYIIIR